VKKRAWQKGNKRADRMREGGNFGVAFSLGVSKKGNGAATGDAMQESKKKPNKGKKNDEFPKAEVRGGAPTTQNRGKEKGCLLLKPKEKKEPPHVPWARVEVIREGVSLLNALSGRYRLSREKGKKKA